MGFPGGSDGKESACIVRDLGSIPGSGASPGEGNGNPLQHSRLENSMDRRAWKATVHGVAKNWTRLSELHTRMLLDCNGSIALEAYVSKPKSKAFDASWFVKWKCKTNQP